jgi:hypothetical protein
MIIAGTRPPWFDAALRGGRAQDDAVAEPTSEPARPVEPELPVDQLSAVDIRPRQPAE